MRIGEAFPTRMHMRMTHGRTKTHGDNNMSPIYQIQAMATAYPNKAILANQITHGETIVQAPLALSPGLLVEVAPAGENVQEST